MCSLLYYKCQKIKPNLGGSYIDSPDKKKEKTINPINKKDDKCFQYAVTVELNHEKNNRPTKNNKHIYDKPYKYNWEGIFFHQKKDDWKEFEKKMV